MLDKKQLFSIQSHLMTAISIRTHQGELMLPNDPEFRMKFYNFMLREFKRIHAKEEQIEMELTNDQSGVSLNGEDVLDNPRPTGPNGTKTKTVPKVKNDEKTKK